MDVFSANRRQFLTRGGAALAGMALWGGARFAAAETPGGGNQEIPLAPPDRQPPKLDVPEKPARQAGWAIVGLGQLALEEVLPAFGLCRISKPVALVSGHADKARKVAAAYNVNTGALYDYGTFDEIADNPAIDIVYNILPNSMHAEYTIRALNAGKHVLCEKPMAVTVEEGEQMIAAAKAAGKMLMIGYRLHYEPFNQKVIELCQEGRLGGIKTFASFNCQDVAAPNIRLSSKLGGGPVGDVGVYCINAARYVTGEEPTQVTAIAHQPKDDPRFREVPESAAFTLRFPSGVLAHCDCSFGCEESRHYRVNGAKGFLDLDNAFGYQGQQLRLKTAEGDTRLVIEPVNHFAAEMDHFSDCVLHGKPCLTPGEMGLADLRVIVAIEEAARTGKSVAITT